MVFTLAFTMSPGALASRRRIENDPKKLAGETPALPGM